jgi:hypothetical protein
VDQEQKLREELESYWRERERYRRERSFISELIPDWRPTRAQILWAVRITIVLVVVLGILTLIGLPFGITLWEWVKLLIVPVVIAAGGLWFNRQQRERELETADRRAQDEALQAYLDQMSQLLTDKDQPLHRTELRDSLSTVARARTLSVLTRLDGGRKGSVLRFLYESGLISKDRLLYESGLISKDHLILDLSGADLSGANLSGANLSEASLSEASLIGAKLQGANLSHADLQSANLELAHLQGANLEVANMREANLRGADLSGASLGGARVVTDDQLAEAEQLQGATMPNWWKYENWLLKKEYEDWLKTPEGRQWLKTYREGKGDDEESPAAASFSMWD